MSKVLTLAEWEAMVRIQEAYDSHQFVRHQEVDLKIVLDAVERLVGLVATPESGALTAGEQAVMDKFRCHCGGGEWSYGVMIGMGAIIDRLVREVARLRRLEQRVEDDKLPDRYDQAIDGYDVMGVDGFAGGLHRFDVDAYRAALLKEEP